CTNEDCKQPGHFRMAFSPPDDVYDYFKIEGNFEIYNNETEVPHDHLHMLTGTADVPKGATFTVIPDDNGDFTMDADKHYEMLALSDVHGWEPCKVTGVWPEIVELDD
nr:hypothetical protein [Tanacetum cinerariifolium]